MVSTNVDHSSPIIENGQERQLGTIDAACLRKINLLTAKERPFCSYCNNLVGYNWFVENDVVHQKNEEDPVDDQIQTE